jgi:hypothetical protein
MTLSMLKQPSAFMPITMSLGALAMIPIYVAMSGIVRSADEGAAARIFQLLLVAQLPIVAWFALKWLRRTPGQALLVLVLQAAAAVAPIALITYLESL